MVDHYSIIHYLYTYFYSKIYNNSNYKFEPSSKSLESISKFLNLLDAKYKLECIGIHFLSMYFLFQFDYWSKLDIKAFNNKIQLNFIIGKKAFERYINRDSNFDYQIYESHLLNVISLNEIKNFFIEDTYLNKLNKFEEIEKNRFYNTDKGFLNCIQHTTLYYHISSHCIACKFKINCKDLLKNNYYNIYIVRDYAKLDR